MKLYIAAALIGGFVAFVQWVIEDVDRAVAADLREPYDKWWAA